MNLAICLATSSVDYHFCLYTLLPIAFLEEEQRPDSCDRESHGNEALCLAEYGKRVNNFNDEMWKKNSLVRVSLLILTGGMYM